MNKKSLFDKYFPFAEEVKRKDTLIDKIVTGAVALCMPFIVMGSIYLIALSIWALIEITIEIQ